MPEICVNKPIWESGARDQKIGNGEYYGMELEVELKKSTRVVDYLSKKKIAPQLVKSIQWGSDGSLKYGIEARWPPMTYEYFMSNKDVEAVIRGIELAGANAWHEHTNGIHIHINRSSFSLVHLYKFVRFFQINARLLAQVARRDINRNNYCQIKHLISQKIAHMLTVDYSDKFSALNMHGPTVECRIFQSTTNIHAIRAYWQFLYALKRFVECTSIKNLSEQNFRQFALNKKFVLLNKLMSENNKFALNKVILAGEAPYPCQ